MSAVEHLILEVLGARHRLGEPYWNFPKEAAFTRAIRSLEDQGLVFEQSPHVEGVREVSLTKAGIDRMIKPNYLSPAERKWLNADPEKVIAAVRRIFEEI